MKKLYFIALLISPIYYLNAQDSDQITYLQTSHKNINDRIIHLKDSLKIIEDSIEKLQLQKISHTMKDSALTAYLSKGAHIRIEPSVLGEIHTTLPYSKKAMILDFDGEYYKIKCDTVVGYVAELWVVSNPLLEEYQKQKIKESENIKHQEYLKRMENIRLEAEKDKRADTQLSEKYIKKYGNATYQKLKSRIIWRGITKEMAIIALGQPDKVNKTVGSWGTHEQWVYGNNTFLYFENGLLNSYQL